MTFARLAPTLPLALALLLALAGAPAGAQSFDTSPEGIADFLRDEGYRAEITADADGNPQIRSSSDGINFSIYFYGCRQRRDCPSVQFSAGFEMRDPVSAEDINDFNGRKRFARGWVDPDGAVFLRQDVTFVGGLSRRNFRDQFQLWNFLLADFVKHIGWR